LFPQKSWNKKRGEIQRLYNPNAKQKESIISTNQKVYKKAFKKEKPSHN